MPLMLYRLEFEGGPQDGLAAYTQHLPDTRLLFPARSQDEGKFTTAYCQIVDATAAVYLFDRTDLVGSPPQIVPAIHYQFRGFEAARYPTPPSQCRARKRSLPSLLASAASRLLKPAWHWIAQPVLYPLQIAPPAELVASSPRETA
jgi:hypothetical protein